MVLEENKATCRVLDKHPNTTQSRLSFRVNPASTVKQLIEQVSTQFTYDKFELIVQTTKVSTKGSAAPSALLNEKSYFRSTFAIIWTKSCQTLVLS